MFTSKSAVLLLAVLTYTSLAFSPLAFIKGFNSELALENDDSINECLSYIVKNSEEESHTCLEAMDSYLVSLFDSAIQGAKAQTTEEATIEAVGAAFRGVENFVEGQNLVSGQEAAQFLKQLATVLKLVSHERILSDANITINATAFVLGFNQQLNIVTGSDLDSCLGDSTQTEVIAKAAVIALQQRHPIQAATDMMSLVKYLPGVKLSCASSIEGTEKFVKPIVKSLLENSTDFFNTINDNLNKNPFAVAADSLRLTQDLKSGNDFNAGVMSGKLTQIALKGIIN